MSFILMLVVLCLPMKLHISCQATSTDILSAINCHFHTLTEKQQIFTDISGIGTQFAKLNERNNIMYFL